MAPPATFIAVQCCQCSTMQVKQQKKSSNKWTCVVCNQKQSVRKVYAQGFMAKDVRKFVQSFNMSRQLADQNDLELAPDNQLENLVEVIDRLPNNSKVKRTDWTEYLDPPEEDSNFGLIGKSPEDGDSDIKVVTEMPKPVFKKPKLINQSDYSTRGKHYTPIFDKRRTKQETSRRAAAEESSSSKCYGAMIKENSRQTHYAPESRREDTFMNKIVVKDGITKWEGGLTEKDDRRFSSKVPLGTHTAKAGASSKWSSYISEENEGLPLVNGRNFNSQASEWKDEAFGIGTELIDQMVEEDIHPDFL